MNHTIPLCENNRFRSLYARGKTAAAGTVAVYIQKNKLKTTSRLGLTTSVKLGCAVKRNCVRRKMRECYRLHEGELQAGYDIVIVARVRAVGSPYKTIERDMMSLFAKLGLICGGKSEKSGD